MTKLSQGLTASNLEFVKDRVIVTTSSGQRLKAPVSRHPVLARAPLAEREKFRLEEGGAAVAWPGLALRLTVPQLVGK